MTDVAAIHGAALDRADRLVAAVRPDQLDRPTPCAEWTVRMLLAHLVDVSETSGREPVHDFETVMTELASFSSELAQKPMLVVASKIDAAQSPERVESLKRLAERRNLPYSGYMDLAAREEVYDLVGNCIQKVNQDLAQDPKLANSQISRFLI